MIWLWLCLKPNCYYPITTGFGETDTSGFLLIIPLVKLLLAGNFCNSVNVKINRELNNYLVSFCDCRKLFPLPKPLPLSYFLVNPCSSCQYLKARTIVRLAFFPFGTTLILVDICTLCAVLSQVEDQVSFHHHHDPLLFSFFFLLTTLHGL